MSTEPVPFVETSVARLIGSVIERAHEYSWNALVTGVPGIGKTRVIAEIVERSAAREILPRVVSMEVAPTARSAVFALLQEMADLIGVHAGRSLADLERELRAMKPWHDYASTIIFDEAQNLSLIAARVLLGISEHSGFRMVFIGNPDVLKLVNSAQSAIQQISRRLPIRETISGIQHADADLLASSFGCEGMEAFALSREIGEIGHADGIVTVLKAARKLAEADGRSTIHRRHIAATLELFPQFKATQRRRATRVG